jgi:hypothetical protein
MEDFHPRRFVLLDVFLILAALQILHFKSEFKDKQREV